MTNKDKYIQLCANENYIAKINLFAQPFWLDEVAENWDVCLVSEDDKITAALPYCWKGKYLTKRIYLPDFNFYQSVIFLKEVENKTEIIIELFQQLPKTVKSYFKLLPKLSNIDLSKQHYQKEDYNTYIISSKQQTINLSTNHKRNIQKGIKQKYFIEVSKNINQSFTLLTSTFARQQVKSKISIVDFEKIITLTNNHHCGKILDCFDNNNNLLASVFIAEDNLSIYYLLGGYNMNFKNSGAMTFLLHQVIQDALLQQKDFNFCGSSKKSIATYFESFGAGKTPISIWKKSIF